LWQALPANEASAVMHADSHYRYVTMYIQEKDLDKVRKPTRFWWRRMAENMRNREGEFELSERHFKSDVRKRQVITSWRDHPTWGAPDVKITVRET